MQAQIHEFTVNSEGFYTVINRIIGTVNKWNLPIHRYRLGLFVMIFVLSVFMTIYIPQQLENRRANWIFKKPAYKRVFINQSHSNCLKLKWKRDEKLDKMAKEIILNDPYFATKPGRIQFLGEYRSPCWKRESRTNVIDCLPLFYIGGYHKCSTSELWKRVELHPEIGTAKELVNGEYVKVKELDWWCKRQILPFDKYLSYWRETSKDIVTGDGSISNFAYNNLYAPYLKDLNFSIDTRLAILRGEISAPHLIVQYLPSAKFIVIMREPGARLYSHYLHIRSNVEYEQAQKSRMKTLRGMSEFKGNVSLDFHREVVNQIRLFRACLQNKRGDQCAFDRAIISANTNAYVNLVEGMYAISIKLALKMIPLKNMLFLKSEDYNRDRVKAMKQIFQFLHVAHDDELVQRIGTEQVHFTGRRSFHGKWSERKSQSQQNPMLPGTRHILTKFYKQYNRQLAALLKSDKFLFRKESNIG